MSAEEVGDRARNSGIKILAWTIPCFYLLGREMLINWGVIKPTDAVEDVVYVMDFWKRFQLSWHRNNGGLTNKQGGHRAQIFPEQKLQVFHADAFECELGDDLHTSAQEFMATVAQYGFLVSCESRLTIHNHGPYKISDNREMLIRDFRELSEYDFPWLDDVANELDYNNLTVAMIVEDTHITLLDDWGSFEAEPELKSEHIKAIGLWTADNLTDGHLPVGMGNPEELTATFKNLTEKVKEATSKLWTQMAGWSRDQQMDAGALNYFACAKELAHIAGCYEMKDWMMIDERAERFRPLLNDEYGNLFLGELVGMITQPSQMAHGYTMAQHTDKPTKGLSFIPYSILKDEPYTSGVGPIRGGVTNLSAKVDRYRTSQGFMTQEQLNKECRSFTMTCCQEKYRLLCADWVKYHYDSELADELFRIEQKNSRNLKDRGAGLTCQDIEHMRLARVEKA